MFSRINGGVEQVFLNYTQALETQGHEVISVIHPWAEIKKRCSKKKLRTVFSIGRNDFIAVRRLRQLIETEQPSCIISHTKRAALLVEKTRTHIPKIAVCHTPQSFSELELVADAIIAITENMHLEISKSRQTGNKVFTVPNMIDIPEDLFYVEPEAVDVPVIGVSARFSNLKGIDVFIEALAILHERHVPFQAKIAGNGKEKKQYRKLIHKYGLQNKVIMLGWIEDKEAFYKSLDVFCHPSLKESFGLVVVESMMHSIPMVLTEISGPVEIIGGTDSAIMVSPSDSMSLANGLELIIRDRNRAKEISFNAFDRVKYYSSRNVGPMLSSVLNEVCGVI